LLRKSDGGAAVEMRICIPDWALARPIMPSGFAKGVPRTVPAKAPATNFLRVVMVVSLLPPPIGASLLGLASS
jgi:hypothetical protein